MKIPWLVGLACLLLSASAPATPLAAPAPGPEAQLHGGYHLVTQWIQAIEEHGARTHTYPARLTDVTHRALPLVSPWGSALTYSLVTPGSYTLTMPTPWGPLTWEWRAFTAVPSILPDADKTDAFLTTLKYLRHALDATYFDEGTYPRDLGNLPERHFPRLSTVITPWGGRVSYRSDGETYNLTADTPSGRYEIRHGDVVRNPFERAALGS